jgi:hypothetical protein
MITKGDTPFFIGAFIFLVFCILALFSMDPNHYYSLIPIVFIILFIWVMFVFWKRIQKKYSKK